MTVTNLRLIGRNREKDILSNCLVQSTQSRGQTVIVSGEAGIGKSTLVDFLKQQAEMEGFAVCMGDSMIQDTSVPYLPFQRALSSITDDEIFQTERFTYFDEVFLISKSGLLISHVSHLKEKGMDEDILGSMLTAVQDFVRDSFGGGDATVEKGGLGKLEYMNTKIFIEHGDMVYLAVVTSGEEHLGMKADVISCLSEIETAFFDILVEWDGDIDSLSGSNEMLKKLVEKKYRVKRSLENINIQSERLIVQNKIFEHVESKANECGLLLVLEDIHWADESTILSIPFIARNISSCKIMFCISYRPDEISTNQEFIQMLDGLRSEPNCQELELCSFTDENIDELASEMLDGEKPPDELLANLKSETQGNPFFITEAVRSLCIDGTLFKDNDVWVMKHGPKSQIPKTVTDLVSNRLESLELDCIRILEYGAILGRRFSYDLLKSGFHMDDSYLREAMNKLVSLNLLSLMENDDVMFQHSKTQEVIYLGMSERLRRISHKNAGLIYEAKFDDNKESVLFNLAYHFSRTYEFDKGIDYCIAAGHKASNNLAPREASQFFERAVEIIESTERKDGRLMEIIHVLSELYELDGNYTKALSILDKIFEGTKDNLRIASAFMIKGRIMQSQSKYDDAIGNYEKGINLADDSGLTLLKAKINGYLGKVYLRKGEYEKAMELQKEFLFESQKTGSKQDMGQAYMNLGGVFWFMSEHQMAIRNWEKALEVFAGLHYMQGVANVNDNLGVGYSTIGQFEKSLEHYQSSEKTMSLIGDVKGMSMVLLNIGVLYDRMGDNSKSLEYYYKSLQIKKKIGDFIGAANIYNNIGAAYFDMGQYEAAAENLSKNLELMEKFDDTWGIAQALNNLADVKIEMNFLDEARKLCERSLKMSKEHDFKEIISSNSRLMGTLASFDADYGSADSLFNESLNIAKDIKDPQRIGMAYFSWGLSLFRMGEREKAIDNLSSALKTFENSGMETYARKVRNEMKNKIDASMSD